MINCKYLFYIKAGANAGLGHLRRSLAIATQLKKGGNSIFFLVDGDKSSIGLLKKKGFDAASYSKVLLHRFSPKMTIIDQKGNVSAQIKGLRSRGSKICLIDNTSKARLISDIVIYPVSHFKDTLNWKGFKGEKYIGAKYFPLNKEFIKARSKKHKTFTLLVTMGGADPKKLTEKVATALHSIKGNFKAVIVLGAASKTQRIPQDPRFIVVKNPKSIAKLMEVSDIAITAFGTTLYELAYMKVPAMIISNFNHDLIDAAAFQNLGTSLWLGYHKNVSIIRITEVLKGLIQNRKKLLKLSHKGKSIVDGKGTKRMIRILENT
ncbi:MAG: hypothetical protein ABH860_06400 [bacterium]